MWATLKARLFNVTVTEDVALGEAFGGMPDLTISAQAAFARDAGKVWGCVLCRILDWIQADHCDTAMHDDIARAQAAENALKE